MGCLGNLESSRQGDPARRVRLDLGILPRHCLVKCRLSRPPSTVARLWAYERAEITLIPALVALIFFASTIATVSVLVGQARGWGSGLLSRGRASRPAHVCVSGLMPMCRRSDGAVHSGRSVVRRYRATDKRRQRDTNDLGRARRRTGGMDEERGTNADSDPAAGYQHLARRHEIPELLQVRGWRGGAARCTGMVQTPAGARQLLVHADGACRAPGALARRRAGGGSFCPRPATGFRHGAHFLAAAC